MFAANFTHRNKVVSRRSKGKVDSDKRKAPMSWMQRLKRVFSIDIETGPGCGGKLRVIACIEDPPLIRQILTHIQRRDALLKRMARAPPVAQQAAATI